MFKSIEVQYKSGIFLPELNLHLDSRIPKEMGFISHAHADHFGRHKKIFCSTQTAQLLIARYKCDPKRIVSLDFYEPFEIGPFLLKLLPAGHIFGSAMLHVISKTNGASLLYTGDFKLRESYTAETNALIPADTLIMETTFGKKPVPQRTGGSIPIVALFEEVLESKTILMGFGLDSDAIHSPNEHFGIWNFLKGIETIPHFFKNYTAHWS